jgi:3-hydroxyisobutyrate dehydrogenase
VAAHLVGFVGLGHMGAPMAANLLAAGFELVVHDRDPDRAARLAGQGARAGSLADVAAAGIVLVSVPGPPEVEAVAAGLLPRLAPGSVLVCTSTVSPALVQRLEHDARPRGVELVDAPVTGAADGARAGTLSIMVGAEPEALERCRPVLEPLSSRIVHTGPVGSGSATKLLTNMLWAVHVVALADALAVGRAAGLDPAVLGEAIDTSAGGSWVSAHDLPNILRGDDDESFPLALCHKDLGLIAELAGGAAPLADLARERFEAAYERFGPEAGELAVTRL